MGCDPLEVALLYRIKQLFVRLKCHPTHREIYYFAQTKVLESPTLITEEIPNGIIVDEFVWGDYPPLVVVVEADGGVFEDSNAKVFKIYFFVIEFFVSECVDTIGGIDFGIEEVGDEAMVECGVEGVDTAEGSETLDILKAQFPECIALKFIRAILFEDGEVGESLMEISLDCPFVHAKLITKLLYREPLTVVELHEDV